MPTLREAVCFLLLLLALGLAGASDRAAEEAASKPSHHIIEGAIR